MINYWSANLNESHGLFPKIDTIEYDLFVRFRVIKRLDHAGRVIQLESPLEDFGICDWHVFVDMWTMIMTTGSVGEADVARMLFGEVGGPDLDRGLISQVYLSDGDI